jgi:hypothetical protein
MRDIASRPWRRIELQEPTIKVANEPLGSCEEGRSAVTPLAEDHCKHIGDRALLDDNAAVNVGFAEFHLWIEENTAFGGMALETNGDWLSGAVSERKSRPACGRDPKRSCAN